MLLYETVYMCGLPGWIFSIKKTEIIELKFEEFVNEASWCSWMCSYTLVVYHPILPGETRFSIGVYDW